MWSFLGSYANRGNGIEQASSDAVARPAGLEPAAYGLTVRRSTN